MDEYMMHPNPPPFYGGSTNTETSTIAEMRWKDNELIQYVEEVLGGYTTVMGSNGRIIKQRPENFKPKINDEGLSGVVSYLRAHLNTSVVLSNFDESKANTLIRIQLIEFAKWLTYNQERFEIDIGDMALIQSVVRPLIVSQVYRAVSGHETRNFHTQSLEHNVQQHSTLQNGQQGGLFSWGKGKR